MRDEDLIYNREKIQEARDLLDEIKDDIADVDYELYDAVMKIGYAYGIDEIERDNTSIDLRVPEQLMIQCREETTGIRDNLSNQVHLIEGFLAGEGGSSGASAELVNISTEEVQGKTGTGTVEETGELIGVAQPLYGPPSGMQPKYGVVCPPGDPTVQPLYGVPTPPDIQPKYGVVCPPGDPTVQPLYGVPTPPDVQPKYGVVVRPPEQLLYGPPPTVPVVQPKYGVVCPPGDPTVQPLYGVPTPPTTVPIVQPKYGVVCPPVDPTVQPLYGVPTPPGVQPKYGVVCPPVDPTVQPLYGVPTPPDIQPKYGVICQPTSPEVIVQPKYGVVCQPTSPEIIVQPKYGVVCQPTTPQQLEVYIPATTPVTVPVTSPPIVTTPATDPQFRISTGHESPLPKGSGETSTVAFNAIPNTGKLMEKEFKLESYAVPTAIGAMAGIAGVQASEKKRRGRPRKKKPEDEE